jgi:hypothetical protein
MQKPLLGLRVDQLCCLVLSGAEWLAASVSASMQS